MHRRILLLVAPVVLLLTLAAIAKPAAVGAPWISIEMPANPLDETTSGAALVVRTYYHENPARFPVTGTAEGLVKGERRTIPLKLTETARAGVYTVQQVWPADGHWLLALNVGGDTGPSLVVELGADGGVIDGTYYGRQTRTLALRSVRVVDTPLQGKEVEQALRTLAMN